MTAAPGSAAGGGDRGGDRGGAERVVAADLRAWLTAFAEQVSASKDLLTQLDSAIGDADHGTNLDRGMTAVVAALPEDGSAPGAVLKAAGMTLVRSVGGASGPLYGTLFLRMGASAGDAADLDAAALGRALRAGCEGVVARGRSEAGDKTMYDAMAPACEAYDAAVADGAGIRDALVAAAAAAEGGRDATEEMLARKGRAAYLGERSIGHVDPGATSLAMLVRAAAATMG